jgi:hypothetical protein
MRRKRRRRPRRPELSLARILSWADEEHARTGRWPRQEDGEVQAAPGEKWININQSLRLGLRGLPGGSSLARLLAAERGARNHLDLPRLTLRQILARADAHRRRTGEWPTRDSGTLLDAPGETWLALDVALQQGHRGLPGGMTLAGLLAEQRGRRHKGKLPKLRLPTILKYADGHCRHTGRWPKRRSGPVLDAPGETWSAIDTALNKGQRGLPGGTTLARLLAAERGVRNHKDLPPLTVQQIVRWMKAHRRRTGAWPTRRAGPVLDAPGEKWSAVETALRDGLRSLPGGMSLRRLVEERRGRG